MPHFSASLHEEKFLLNVSHYKLYVLFEYFGTLLSEYFFSCSFQQEQLNLLETV